MKLNNVLSDFMSSIIQAFNNFVNVFKQNGLVTVTFVLMLFMLLYSFVINPVNINDIVQQTLIKEKSVNIEMQEQSIDRRIKADKIINEMMEHIVDNFNVNRCLMLEIHNGTSNLAGVDYLYYTATNEVISTANSDEHADEHDIEYVADMFQRQNISNFIGTTTYNKLKYKAYVYYDNLDNYARNQYRLVHKMKLIGAESMMLVPFVKNDIPMAILLVSSKDKSMNARDIYDCVDSYKNIIEANLMPRPE